MFAIGEARSKVRCSKLSIPKEYNLRRFGRKIYGVWIGDKILYLSDEVKVLELKSRKNSLVFEIKVDVGSRIRLPERFNKSEAKIRGCLSIIEIQFD